ncbi:MAG: aminotransferase class III-fold pyridoxal phosphate-dependent enzyme, partial [Deltaproteobacteria bacterium]|nr:aminotransferase class III-fold pyridoxal phosphate-dependent enzyme [Deltaproteobacteria bacterium]
TTGGSELGCIVALKVLEIIERPGVLENVQVVAEFLSQKLNELKQRHSFLIDIRQNGLIVGLQFDDPNGAMLMTAYSYESGLWAFPAGFDRSVLQFKLNILVSKKECQEALQLFENALTALENDIFKSKG